MTRKWIVPAVVMAVWLGGLYAIEPLTDNVDLQGALFAAFTVAAGLLANRWWVLLVPFLIAVVLTALPDDSANPCSECRDELGWQGTLFLGMMFAALTAVLLAIGVGARRIAALVRRRYSSRARNAL